MKSVTILIALLAIISCKSQKEQLAANDNVASDVGITFIDSTDAAQIIVTDDTDRFFDHISVVEISIQMKNEAKYDSRAAAVAAYKNMLQTQVMTYSDAERDTLQRAFTEAKKLVDAINPKLWPKSIQLVKVRTDHYGPDVYYTREHAIMIPENVWTDGRPASALVPVMLHEVFHLISRYDDELRRKLYALIDFVPHGKSDVTLSRALEQKRLCNPDGMNMDYAVQLKGSDGEQKLAMPFLISNKPYYSSSIPTFFAYLKFDLYPLETLNNGSALLVSDLVGNTVLPPEMQNDYFAHIGDNTQYVIHPDEIMADNFMLALQTAADQDYSQYSTEGKELIESVLSVLSDHN